MDIFTQGLLGASVAQSAAPREESRVAAAIGFATGLLADADVLIQSADDPLLNLDYHRHFSHALIFIPVGALLGAALLWPFFRKRLSFARLYRYSLLGYLLSGLLDACTSYGTHLLWPFSDARSAWHLVSVIDPLFTGALLLGAATTLLARRTGFARAGLALAALYLAFAFAQQQRALEIARGLALSRGQEATAAEPRNQAADGPELAGEKRDGHILIKPSFANTIVWRSVYIAGDRIYVDAIRPGLFGETRIYEGESVPLFDGGGFITDTGISRDSTLARDIERFRFFSHGYVAVHPACPGILGDIRFSMLPNSALPMWGIELNPTRADEHAQFRAFRELSRQDRERFVDMLAGRVVVE